MNQKQPTKSTIRSKAIKGFALVSFSVGAGLLYLLSTASAKTALLAQHYTTLLVVSAAIVFVLSGFVAYQLFVLLRRLKAGVFGSRLALRLLAFFALMAIIPGSLVYAVSFQFLGKSIESWFDVTVERALESGLNLGHSSLENMLSELNKKADSIALSLTEHPSSEHLLLLNNLREHAGVQDATLFNQHGTIIAVATNEQSAFLPSLPSPAVLRQVRSQQPYSAIESIPGHGLYLRVVVPVNLLSVDDDIRILQLTEAVPENITGDAEIVQTGYQDYQELLLSRDGLKRLYWITLTLTLILALLSAITLAFLLSERLSTPLVALGEGTQAVAQGDFTTKVEVSSQDEFGVLTRSFNSMTQQLWDARASAQQNQSQLEAAKTYLESILTNLSAGVISLDEAFNVRSLNPSAGLILNVDNLALLETNLGRWQEISPQLATFSAETLESLGQPNLREWEKQIKYVTSGGDKVLLVRGMHLHAESNPGYVVVFDDITHLLQAQRQVAWGEVARRLAHEIKNPLTPIQLSAERLQLKLSEKLNSVDAEILNRSTQTIVNQVLELKTMVNAFGEYARSPESNPIKLDLNQLIQEVLELYDSLNFKIELKLAPGLPQILGDPSKLRQVIHNLMQNAQDAASEVSAPQITVVTNFTGQMVWLSVIDNGPGFQEQMMSRVFEPYVTTKPKGTGLGLAIVKKIVEEHSGSIQIENVQAGGASVSVLLPRAQVETEQQVAKSG